MEFVLDEIFRYVIDSSKRRLEKYGGDKKSQFATRNRKCLCMSIDSSVFSSHLTASVRRPKSVPQTKTPITRQSYKWFLRRNSSVHFRLLYQSINDPNKRIIVDFESQSLN